MESENEKIVQIIPCSKPLMAVYSPTEGYDEYWFNWIYFMGLTDEGMIRPIDFFDGFPCSAMDIGNFYGVYADIDGLEEEPFYEKMKEWRMKRDER